MNIENNILQKASIESRRVSTGSYAKLLPIQVIRDIIPLVGNESLYPGNYVPTGESGYDPSTGYILCIDQTEEQAFYGRFKEVKRAKSLLSKHKEGTIEYIRTFNAFNNISRSFKDFLKQYLYLIEISPKDPLGPPDYNIHKVSINTKEITPAEAKLVLRSIFSKNNEVKLK
jgi:hypothetical protein